MTDEYDGGEITQHLRDLADGCQEGSDLEVTLRHASDQIVELRLDVATAKMVIDACRKRLELLERARQSARELEAAMFCPTCNGTGRDRDQYGDFDCRKCKAAEIRRELKKRGEA